MITVFKDKNDIPQGMEYIELNDLFFNQNTAIKLDERAALIVERVEQAKMVGRYKMESKFNGVLLDIDQLSTGCKTVLNVMYFPDKVFCMKECGDNALEMLYKLEQGFVYSDYTLVPFEMEKVMVYSNGVSKVIDDYEELKEWWSNEK